MVDDAAARLLTVETTLHGAMIAIRDNDPARALEMITNALDAARPTAAPLPRRREGTPRLTEREQTILTYLTTNLTAADIAEELYLSVNTVKTHIAGVYRKLGARRRREAVRRARELELL